ncbi:MAG: DUF1835 domain-containing protein [Bacteroidia bacterium]
MTYHILNGDALTPQIRSTTLSGEFIVCRECMVEGDLTGANTEELLQSRAAYIAATYSDSEATYFQDVVPQFEKIRAIPPHSAVCLWFEDDLFCQANMWFVLSLLPANQNLQVWRIFPVAMEGENKWKGFGWSDCRRLEQAFGEKILFAQSDIELGKNLWEAYRASDFRRLTTLSTTLSPCFRDLNAVCQAHIDRFPPEKSRPKKVLTEIISSGITQFAPAFRLFSEKEGIYGFGDLQVKRIFDEIISDRNL